ncbi:diguanylate cyclase [Chitinivorax sp. B]|uniref:diguanylate cyclase n=1 Tax=Chitinivorax sp. B TaxID=2502235 RepID=UPI0010F6B24D|nr:diguanylate cyclase [Chitinivorax sp. B]
MTLRLKFNLVLFLVCLCSLGGTSYYIYRSLYQNALEEVRRESRLHMETALAVRLYTTHHVKPWFDKVAPNELIPPTVPAFAARQTMSVLHARYPGYEYREATLNPTNPINRAMGWERALVDQYRSGKLTGQVEHIIEDKGAHVLKVTRPIQINNESCLSCHGDPAKADPMMLKHYGDKAGFNWHLNEIVGAQIITVPANVPLEHARSAFVMALASLIAGFAALFIALNVMLSLAIINPMSRTNALLEHMAATDGLTGLLNRRKFMEKLNEAIETSGDDQFPLSVIMFDVDHFKQVNDNHGHKTGDEVLRIVAHAVGNLIKGGDSLGRLGGEEFAVILPHTPLSGAATLADALRKHIAGLYYPADLKITASFGVALMRAGESADSVLHRADDALYAAKRAGRNQVICAPDAGETDSQDVTSHPGMDHR